MSQGRIVPLLGPLLVLYLTLEVVGSSSDLDLLVVLVCGFALALSAVPLAILRGRTERSGVRRVALLAVVAGVSLLRFAEPELPSVYLDVVRAFGLPLVGGLTAHLALDAPDEPPALRKRGPWVFAFALGGLVVAVGAALAVAPAEWFGSFLVPARWRHAPLGFLALCLGIALGLRLLRRRLGSTPEALAAGGAAHLGTWVAFGSAAAALGLVVTGTLSAQTLAVRGLVALAAVALVLGHVAMLGGRRQVRAGPNMRAVITATLALAVVGAGAGALADLVPRAPIPFGVSIALAAAASVLLYRLFRRAVGRLFAPFSGRLVRGCERALAGAVGATSFEELGGAVLPHLCEASGAIDAEPLLVALDPARRVRVDSARVARVEERGISPAILERLAERSGEVIVTAPLAERVVRRPNLRELVEALDMLDALCVVPLSREMELEGVLVVPRGRRRAALTLEELDALERLGHHLSAQVSMLSAEERARVRTRDALISRAALAEELEATEEELGRLRADAQILKAGGAAERYTAPAIAYSPSMRRVMRRVQEIAPVEAPVLLTGEEGSALDRVAHRLHAASGRREGPFVVADCAAVRPERAKAALFGEGDAHHPGWLRLAEGGTCLLLDVPALSLEAQAQLAEALATRRTALADGSGSYAVDARVVATSRVDLGQLAAAGSFDAELWRRLEPVRLAVPPLRERREDLPSLVLLTLDRVCRTSGRPVVGADPKTLELLVAHDWPGNLRELESVIDRAVAQTAGTSVGPDDLPPLAPAAEPPDPWTGTYAEIEAEALRSAMERSGGNKSEAARLLGLKRTTFLDKLKRHSLTGAKKAPAAEVVA